MTSHSPKLVRCAIYTRVSSNLMLVSTKSSLLTHSSTPRLLTLRAKPMPAGKQQRQRYDDGGFSGGSTDRPALQELMADIQAGRIDVIVVYKVDRLTRSLADFAKLVELFDKHGVSFVPPTQQFNTTTSMGRLTLNVLLSFAQFEREVTSERIRTRWRPPSARAVVFLAASCLSAIVWKITKFELRSPRQRPSAISSSATLSSKATDPLSRSYAIKVS